MIIFDQSDLPGGHIKRARSRASRTWTSDPSLYQASDQPRYSLYRNHHSGTTTFLLILTMMRRICAENQESLVDAQSPRHNALHVMRTTLSLLATTLSVSIFTICLSVVYPSRFFPEASVRKFDCVGEAVHDESRRHRKCLPYPEIA